MLLMFYILCVMHTLILNLSLCLQPAVDLPTKITCMQENCNKFFSTPYNFHQHLRRHMNTFHFFCEVCGKGFVNKNHWESHKASHTQDHSFLCSKCSKSFTTKLNLNRHFKLCKNMMKKIPMCHLWQIFHYATDIKQAFGQCS